jgi:hypothetical protein
MPKGVGYPSSLKPQSGKYDPDRGPKKKYKLGANREPHSTHPGRRGLYGQLNKSMGYVHKGKQKPSGTGGSD